MTDVVAIGECMVELTAREGGYAQGFAGDVYNTAVYLKRLAGAGANVAFATAVGEDPVSRNMTAAWRDERLDCSLVYSDAGALPGLYMVQTDNEGERSFLYWRRDSAARRFMTHFKEQGGAQQMLDATLIYFSDITLAIFSPEDRNALFAALIEAKARGASVAFDPNYRPRLWSSKTEARDAFECAYAIATVALPGIDDEAAVFGETKPEAVIARLRGLGVVDIALKLGTGGVAGHDGVAEWRIPFRPAATVVDTTAAGDAFDGAYLAMRQRGRSGAEAGEIAAKVGAFVVGFKGAIAPRRAFESFVETLEL
jgi:2-dehydro-3-deoxygluconokinase